MSTTPAMLAVVCVSVHTHDDFDWSARLADLRRRDSVAEEAYRSTADRLVAVLKPGATIIDIGSGAGGMAAQLGLALRAHGGGRLVLVDAVEELLDAATEHVRTALSGPGATVTVDTVLGDAASDELGAQVPTAELVWASAVVHHLRDQQEGVTRLAGLLAPGGWLALAEGGLGTQCLPWDLGVGEPGLIDRLTAGAKAWFAQMRADIPGSVRLPVGWTRSLADAGLVDVTSFSYVIDHPAPVSDDVRAAVVKWLAFMGEVSTAQLAESDRIALARLLDPADPAFVGARDDLFYLASATVNLGRRG